MDITNSNSFLSNIQEIHTKPDGTIIDSSNVIFEIPVGSNLFELHPFFESLEDSINDISGLDNSLAFPCVQLQINGKEVICDITIKNNLGKITVLLFDYSTHYENLHEAAQDKKTAMLNEQEYELTKKYLEEKNEYLSFMRERIDAKLIGGLEYIVSKLNSLKETQLQPEQKEIIQDIQDKVGTFHLKAIQIKEELEFEFDE